MKDGSGMAFLANSMATVPAEVGCILCFIPCYREFWQRIVRSGLDPPRAQEFQVKPSFQRCLLVYGSPAGSRNWRFAERTREDARGVIWHSVQPQRAIRE